MDINDGFSIHVWWHRRVTKKRIDWNHQDWRVTDQAWGRPNEQVLACEQLASTWTIPPYWTCVSHIGVLLWVWLYSRRLVGYSWWILTYTHARYMFFHGLPSHRCVQNVELANWRTLGVVWGCLQTWLAGKSPTCFVDFPMKNTFFKPPCIAGAISPARKDSVAQRGESSGCSVLSPK